MSKFLYAASFANGRKVNVSESWMRFAFSVYRLRNFFAGELGTLVNLSLEKKQIDKTVTTNVKIQTVSHQPVTPTSFFRILARQCPIVPADQTKKSVLKCQRGMSKKTILSLRPVFSQISL